MAIAVCAVVLGLLGFLLPILLGLKLTTDARVVGPRSVEDLLNDFGRRGYDLAAVAAGRSAAPRLFLAELPRDWRGLAQADARKRAFIMVALPLVLRANEQVLADRARMLDLAKRVEAGAKLSAGERRWLEELAAGYGIDAEDLKPGALKSLKYRVDIVPPSLAIAQGAMESGWGTSRFATEGNALYGQWSEERDGGMVPAARDAGRTYAIKRFASLSDSVASYMRNLNTHRAYRKFRAVRAELRRSGGPLAGEVLAEKLTSYSARGMDYVRAVESIIAKNGLNALDGARLRS